MSTENYTKPETLRDCRSRRPNWELQYINRLRRMQIVRELLRRILKILVSVVRFRPWPPFSEGPDLAARNVAKTYLGVRPGLGCAKDDTDQSYRLFPVP